MISFGVQAQRLVKRKFYKPAKHKRLISAVKVKVNKAPFYSQGNIFISSEGNKLLAHFILRNNNVDKVALVGANITINGKKINTTNVAGEYKGFVPLPKNNSGQYKISLKIITKNKRILTAHGTVKSMLHMQISNIFPKQPNKIDVGSPVRITWTGITQPVTLQITNVLNNHLIYKKVINKTAITLPVNIIPRRKTVKIKVSVPVIRLKYNQATQSGSKLNIHVKAVKVLHTFG
jgi:hypothetical protein